MNKFLERENGDENRPIKVRRRWPEIIFAERRIDKVIGRINNLIVSIITINGIKIIGVLFGIIWAHEIQKKLKKL